MGPIARRFSILAIFAFHQVSSQQPIPQYLVPNYASHAPIQPPRPNIPVPMYPNIIPTAPTKPAPPKAPAAPKSEPSSGSVDSNVLNNLAIALQLLIVSNLMNIPSEDKNPLSINLKIPKAKVNPQIAPEASIPLQSLIELLSKPSCQSQFQKSVFYEFPKPVLSYETRLSDANYVTSQFIDPLSIDFKVPKAKINPLIASEASIPLQSLLELLSKPSYQSQLPKSVYYEMPKPVLSYEKRLSNANYVGGSQLIDNGFAVKRPNPRQGMMLMSPYDALGTSVTEPLSSLAYTKRDFQNPYASILAADGYKDLFSVGNLF